LDSECGRDIDFQMISADTENSNKFPKNQALEGKGKIS
jgi:hypothetical protein